MLSQRVYSDLAQLGSTDLRRPQATLLVAKRLCSRADAGFVDNTKSLDSAPCLQSLTVYARTLLQITAKNIQRAYKSYKAGICSNMIPKLKKKVEKWEPGVTKRCFLQALKYLNILQPPNNILLKHLENGQRIWYCNLNCAYASLDAAATIQLNFCSCEWPIRMRVAARTFSCVLSKPSWVLGMTVQSPRLSHKQVMFCKNFKSK